jgi:3-hydroxyacyl-[acyl-carrier-protein] dehydratase
MPQIPFNEENLRESMRRCPADAVTAAISYAQNHDVKLLPTIVLGIIERFVEPDVRPKLREGGDDVRLAQDLGIDSLLMVEIVILVEEVLSIHVENEELRTLQTIGDLKAYLEKKLTVAHNEAH